MAEYIKREVVIKHLRDCEGTPPEIGYTYPIFKAIECFVEGVPAADVVEVVRCKDCKHYHADTLSCDFTPFSKYYERPNWYEDDFCSYGEREDNG